MEILCLEIEHNCSVVGLHRIPQNITVDPNWLYLVVVSQ